MVKKEKTLADVLLREMDHFCIVVKDIEEAVRYFSKMGIEFGDIELRVRSPDVNPTTLRGKLITYTLKVVKSKNTKPTLELEDVVEGRPLQKEFIEAKGQGVQHVCYYTEDLEVAIANFKELGIGVLQRPVAPHTWAMMDTAKMCGFHIEIHE